MKIVVDIDENLYNRIISTNHLIGFTDPMSCEIAIMHSIPLTESDDCVSRKAVLDIFGDVHPLDYNTNAYASQIKNLPSVQSKRESCEAKCLDCLLTEKVMIKDNITNGDVIKAVFPNGQVFNEETTCVTVKFSGNEYDEYVDFYTDWWNEKYKVEREDS